MRAVDNGLLQVRRVIPLVALRALVRRHIDVLMQDPEFREMQESELRFLLGHTDRAHEIPVLAHAFAFHSAMRAHDRWHPRKMRRQDVRGIEWLTTKRDPDRGVILNFMHHNDYPGVFTSLTRAGAGPILIVAMPTMLEAGVDPGMRQMMRTVLSHRSNRAVAAAGGTDFIASHLKPGTTMAIASDLPGRTEVTFLGRRVLASFGAARIATMTNSPVVVVTAVREGAGHYLQLHPPLEPREFEDPADLLDEMLRIHGEAVLAWPEALETPTARLGSVPD
ncbi:MAG: hypothetical protein JWR52_852 [Marmoricola sp.]|nr:hypothetical protein [Marmoricola sp.]